MADHLRTLRLTAAQGPRRPVEGEIAETDLDERVEQVQQPRDQRCHARVVDAPQPFRGIGDLHRAHVRDRHAADLRGERRLVEPGPTAGRARLEDGCRLHELLDVGLQRLDVLAEHRLANLRDQALVGHVDALELDLARLGVEQVLTLLLGHLLDRDVLRNDHLVGRHHPPVGGVAGHQDRPIDQRLRLVDDDREVEIGDRPTALALGTHAAEVDRVLDDRLLAVGPGHHAASAGGGDVEGERGRTADVRISEPAEQRAQHRVGVGDRAEGRARVGAEPLLVDQDGGGQPLHRVDLGSRQAGHEPLDEGRVRLVDQPPRLRSDGAEDQRRLPRPRHPGEHREPPLGDLDRDVLEVVLPGPLDSDQVVIVCAVLAHAAQARS